MSGFLETRSVSVVTLPLRVVKVGGSLLNWLDLPAALRYWLAAEPPAINVLICGGGPFAEAVREADRAFGLSERAAHWLAIDALHVTARLLAAMLPDVPLRDSYRQLTESLGDRTTVATIVFDVREFLRNQDQNARRPLPQDWTVTSDSIAARLATALKADELVLLKSADPPADDLGKLAAVGYVDEHFPHSAAGLLRLRFVNLRSTAGAALQTATTVSASR